MTVWWDDVLYLFVTLCIRNTYEPEWKSYKICIVSCGIVSVRKTLGWRVMVYKNESKIQVLINGSLLCVVNEESNPFCLILHSVVIVGASFDRSEPLVPLAGLFRAACPTAAVPVFSTVT